MARITMVYDADGGLAGELRYVVGHLLGRAECSLCDITHGPLKRKADFDDLVSRLESDGHQVRVVHRNEQTPDEAAASSGHLPCVLIDQAIAISAPELRRCDGDVGALGSALDEALSA